MCVCVCVIAYCMIWFTCYSSFSHDDWAFLTWKRAKTLYKIYVWFRSTQFRDVIQNAKWYKPHIGHLKYRSCLYPWSRLGHRCGCNMVAILSWFQCVKHQRDISAKTNRTWRYKNEIRITIRSYNMWKLRHQFNKEKSDGWQRIFRKTHWAMEVYMTIYKLFMHPNTHI